MVPFVRREDVLHEVLGALSGAPGNQAPHLPEPALDLVCGDDLLFTFLIAPVFLVLARHREPQILGYQP